MVGFRYSEFNLPFLTIKTVNGPDNYNEREMILHLTSKLYLKKTSSSLRLKYCLEFAASVYSKPDNVSC